MDQSKNAKALKAKYRKIATKNQWFQRLTDYIRRLTCWERQKTDKGRVIPSIIGDHPLEECPPDLVNITCAVTIIQPKEVSQDLEHGPKFNPSTLKDLATEVYLKGTNKRRRRRRRHTFFEVPFCGPVCSHHDHYFPVQTEKLREKVQAPYYTV